MVKEKSQRAAYTLEFKREAVRLSTRVPSSLMKTSHSPAMPSAGLAPATGPASSPIAAHSGPRQHFAVIGRCRLVIMRKAIQIAFA